MNGKGLQDAYRLGEIHTPALFVIAMWCGLKLLTLAIPPDGGVGFFWRGAKFLADFGLILLGIALVLDFLIDKLKRSKP